MPRNWVLLFHGVADNRMGVLGFADFLLRHGYGVVMMDSRAHGESGGTQATYGWQERGDVKDIVNQLETRFPRSGDLRDRRFDGRQYRLGIRRV